MERFASFLFRLYKYLCSNAYVTWYSCTYPTIKNKIRNLEKENNLLILSCPFQRVILYISDMYIHGFSLRCYEIFRIFHGLRSIVEKESFVGQYAVDDSSIVGIYADIYARHLGQCERVTIYTRARERNEGWANEIAPSERSFAPILESGRMQAFDLPLFLGSLEVPL